MNIRPIAVSLAFVAIVGCDRSDKPEPMKPDKLPPPVVRQAPVETLPYEDGYELGYKLGEAAAKPRAELPDAEAIEAIAEENATGETRRADKWKRGFAAGYLAGYRRVALNQK
jgi:hypothetical protein